MLAGLNDHLRGIPQLGRIERLVETAAFPASAATILVSGVGLAFVLSLLVALATGSGAMIVLFFFIGLAAPLLMLRTVARRRIAAVEQQLPDVLATIASSLRVGHGLKQALQTVASEGAPPLSVELRRVLSESRLGRPLEEAFVTMCERLGSDDLIYVATAVDVQSQVGGSLAGVFDTVAETVRERQGHRRRLRAITATGRATAYVMAVMPFGFLFLLLLVSPHYVTPFLGSHMGHVLMLASVMSIGIGTFILSRIVAART
jgi:tight adherence protein B